MIRKLVVALLMVGGCINQPVESFTPVVMTTHIWDATRGECYIESAYWWHAEEWSLVLNTYDGPEEHPYEPIWSTP